MTYKWLVKAYFKTLMRLIDSIMNCFYSLRYKNGTLNQRICYFLVKDMDNETNWEKRSELFKKITELYVYRPDPLGGLLNWNYKKYEAIAATEFKGDCDKFASLAQMAYPGRNRIAILPKNILKLHKAHVIYFNAVKVRQESGTIMLAPLVFSSGNIYQTTLENYLEIAYPEKDWFIIEMPDGE
jgi:hypothetical protein